MTKNIHFISMCRLPPAPPTPFTHLVEIYDACVHTRDASRSCKSNGGEFARSGSSPALICLFRMHSLKSPCKILVSSCARVTPPPATPPAPPAPHCHNPLILHMQRRCDVVNKRLFLSPSSSCVITRPRPWMLIKTRLDFIRRGRRREGGRDHKKNPTSSS